MVKYEDEINFCVKQIDKCIAKSNEAQVELEDNFSRYKDEIMIENALQELKVKLLDTQRRIIEIKQG